MLKQVIKIQKQFHKKFLSTEVTAWKRGKLFAQSMQFVNSIEPAHIYFAHCAKVQKYEQSKIGLQFFDMWYL